jgi:hypothetical protein|tara:strand:- start:123 stop:710 length:588 start_codon:yes stop_codon:yes gene_type:complete
MSYYSNIIKVYKQANASELQHGLTWYAEAKDAAQVIADKYQLPLHIVIGVIAALSPTNNWTMNLRNGDDMCRIFTQGGYVEDTKPSTYKTMRDKAWHILQSMPHDLGGVVFILNGPKISDFAQCIAGEDVCVIDGHAWCIANDDRRVMQEVPNIGKKLRLELQKAYSKAGKKHGLTAYQMQAATWVAWRRIHGIG